MLQRNLDALARIDPALAQRIARATPAPLAWSASKAGPLTATLQIDGRQLSLASRFDPQAEAKKLTANVDPSLHAGMFVMGLALGYHAALLATYLDDTSVLVIFEPDLSLCRAVFEKIDHSVWLGKPNVVLVDDTVDIGALVRRVEHYAGYMAQGVVLVTHPVVRQTHPEPVKRFGQLVTELMGYCRTNVATALVNMSRTVSNLTANLGYYAAGASIDELKNIAQGFPAVCVSAGPSLARNIDLLQNPAWREKVVVISVQTTLKPLLDRGIKPDFVTALDYHAISRRFYEDIGPLPDVTLVAEPKVNAAVLEAYPGPMRFTRSNFLERCLSPASPNKTALPNGATVAHLSVYLAQYLGCDPIILTGQDLGFSDGLYYCPGSAIHDVWANELGRYNTLEMMEWQRIVRHRNHLSKHPDCHGTPIYSDEQMLTYLKQFERDFLMAPQTIINATQGGLPILHTQNATLHDALTRYATRVVPPLPLPEMTLDPGKLQQARKLMRQRVEDIQRIRRTCQQTIPLLERIVANQRDQAIVTRLFGELEQYQKEIHERDIAFGLINELNTIGSFRRNRSDRAIHHQHADPFERQRLQLTRDLENLGWLTQACDEALRAFGESIGRLGTLLDEPAVAHNP